MYQTRNALNYLRSQYQAILTKARILGMAVKYAIPLLFCVPITCIPPAFAENTYDYYANSFADTVELDAFAPLNKVNSSITPSDNSLVNLTQDIDLSQIPSQELMITGNAMSTEGDYQFVQINLNPDQTTFNFNNHSLNILGGAASQDGNFLMLSGNEDGRITELNQLQIQAGDADGLLIQGQGLADFRVDINSVNLNKGLLKVGGAVPDYYGDLELNVGSFSMDDGLVDIVAGNYWSEDAQGSVSLLVDDLVMNGGLLRLEGGAGSSSDPLHYGGVAGLKLNYSGVVNSGSIELKGGQQSAAGAGAGAGAAKLTIAQNAVLTLREEAKILNQGTINVEQDGRLHITTQDQFYGILSGTLVLNNAKFDASSLLEPIKINNDQFNKIAGNGTVMFNELTWDESSYSRQDMTLDASRLSAGKDGIFTVSDGQLKVRHFLDIVGESPSGARDKLEVIGGSINFEEASSDGQGSFDVASSVLAGINVLGKNWKFVDVSVSAPNAIKVGDSVAQASLCITESLDSNSETGSIMVTNNSTLDLANSLDLSFTQGSDGSVVIDVGKAANSINLQQGGLLKIDISQATSDGSTLVEFTDDYAESLLHALVTNDSNVDISQLYLLGSSNQDLDRLVKAGSGYWQEVYEVTHGINFEELKNFDLLYVGQAGGGEEESIYGNFGSVTSVSGKNVMVEEGKTLILNGNNRDNYLVAALNGSEKTAGTIELGFSRDGSGGGSILTLQGDGLIGDILAYSYDGETNTVNIDSDVQGRNIGAPDKRLNVNYNAGSHSKFENVYADILNSEAGSVAEVTAFLEAEKMRIAGEVSTTYLNVVDLQTLAGSTLRVQEDLDAEFIEVGGELSAKSLNTSDLQSLGGSTINVQEGIKSYSMEVNGEISAKSLNSVGIHSVAGSKINIQEGVESEKATIGGELSAKSINALNLHTLAGSQVNIQEVVEANTILIEGEHSAKSINATDFYTLNGSKVDVQEGIEAERIGIGGELAANYINALDLNTTLGSQVNVQAGIEAERINIGGELVTNSINAKDFYTDSGSQVHTQEVIVSELAEIGGELAANSINALTIHTLKDSHVTVQEGVESDSIGIEGELSAKSLEAIRIYTLAGSSVNIQENVGFLGADNLDISGQLSAKSLIFESLYTNEGAQVNIQENVEIGRGFIQGDFAANSINAAELHTLAGSKVSVQGATDSQMVEIGGEFSASSINSAELNTLGGSHVQVQDVIDSENVTIGGVLTAKSITASDLRTAAGSQVNVQGATDSKIVEIGGELSASSLNASSIHTLNGSQVKVQEGVKADSIGIEGELSAKSLAAVRIYTLSGSTVNVQENVGFLGADSMDISGQLSAKSLVFESLYTHEGAQVDIQDNVDIDRGFIKGELSADSFKFRDVLEIGDSQQTGALYVNNLDTSQGSLICVDPDWSQETAILSAHNVTGTGNPNDMVLGTNILVGQNSAMFVGLDKAGTNATLAHVKSNLGNLKTSWGPDGVGSMLYLNEAISLAPNKRIYLTGQPVDSVMKANATDPSKSKTLTLNPNTALVISKNAVNTAKNNNAKGAVIEFKDQASLDVRQESWVILDGDFKKSDSALIFSDPDNRVEFTGDGLQDNKIVVSTLNGALTGLIGEDGKLWLDIADDVEEHIDEASDDWYEEIIKVLEEDIGDNPSEGKKFLKEVATKGDGSELEVISQLPAFSGAVQASLTASQASVSAVTERLWSSRDVSSMSLAGNGMGANMWLMPFFQNFHSQDMSANGQPYGVDMDSSGMSLGYDFSIKDWFTIGGMLNKGDGSSNGKQIAEGVSSNYDYYSVGLYGGYCFEKWGFFTSFAYSEVNSDAEAGFGFADIKSSLDSTCYDIVLAGKYRWDFESYSITPHLELHYTNLNIDGYKVKNKANDAVISTSSSATANMLAIPVGATFETVYQFDDWTIKPSLDLTVVFNVGDSEIENMVTLSGLEDLPVPNQTEVLDDRSYSAHAAVVVRKGWLNLNFAIDYTDSENTGGLRFGASASLAF